MAISLTKDIAEQNSVIDLLKRLGLEVGVLVDRSGSMITADFEIVIDKGIGFGLGKKTKSISRYEASKVFVDSLIEQILIHDPQPDLGTFSGYDSSTYFTNCSIGSKQHRDFMAMPADGATYIIPCLNKALKAHNMRGGKTLNFVILDGECHDLHDLKSWIKDTAQGLNSSDEFHLVFIKVGEVNLKKFFQEIEDLEGAKFDIVSTYSLKKIQEEGIGKHLQKIFAKSL